MNDQFIRMQAEIVNGRCPTCHEMTILVGLSPEYFRCINCGADLQQHINGKISYLPTITGSMPLSQIQKMFGHDEKS